MGGRKFRLGPSLFHNLKTTTMKTSISTKNIPTAHGAHRNSNVIVFLMMIMIFIFSAGNAQQCSIVSTTDNQTICLGDSTRIKSGPDYITSDSSCSFVGLTYNWMPGNLSGQAVIVSPNATTVYTVTATDSQGNTYSSTLPVYVTVCANNCTMSVNASPNLICLGNSAVLNAAPNGSCNNSYTYTWMPGNLSGQSVLVSPIATTEYTLTVIDLNNNDTTVMTIPVFVNNCGSNCVVSAYCANQTICLGDSTFLKVYQDSSCTGNTFAYSWEPGNILGQYAMVSPIATTVYTLTAVDQNGVSQVSTVTIFVNNCNVGLVAYPFASNQTICLGDSTTLYATVSGGVPPYIYQWTPGNLSGQTVVVTPMVTTMYTLMVTDQNGDTVTTTIPVFVNNCQNNCVADFSGNNDGNNIVSFTNLSTSASFYFWSFGDGFISTEQNPVHQYANEGTYQVCLVIVNCDNSCSDQVCRTVTVEGKKKEEKGGVKGGKGCDIKLYPNPAGSNVNVSYSIKTFSDIEINLTDMLGNTIVLLEKGSKDAGTYSSEYDANDLINGIYMVNLVTNEGVISKQLVIAK